MCGTCNLCSYSNNCSSAVQRATIENGNLSATQRRSPRCSPIGHDPRDHHYSKDEGSLFLIILESVTGAIGTSEPKGTMYSVH